MTYRYLISVQGISPILRQAISPISFRSSLSAYRHLKLLSAIYPGRDRSKDITMNFTRRIFFPAAVITTPAIYAYGNILRLERDYPRLEPSISSSRALRTAPDPTRFHTPHIDVYGAKIPAKLLSEQGSLDGAVSSQEAWARFFLQSPILKFEGRMVGGFTRGPGDLGEKGFHIGQKLLNGMGEVIVASARPATVPLNASTHQEAPILLQWEFPPPGVDLYRKAAKDWGFPYRVMSYGRHEFGLGEVDEEGMVEVRFATAHDYEWLPEEGDAQKLQPKWVGRLHRAFAMWLLDERVRALKKNAERASPDKKARRV